MKLPKRIQDMHTMYGKKADHICGSCKHFRILKGYAGIYFKCDLTNMTHGSATDWRKKWPACGKLEVE